MNKWEKFQNWALWFIDLFRPHVREVMEEVVPYVKQAVAVILVLLVGGGLYTAGDWFITAARLPDPWSHEVRAWLTGMPMLAVISMVRTFHGRGGGSTSLSK